MGNADRVGVLVALFFGATSWFMVYVVPSNRVEAQEAIAVVAISVLLGLGTSRVLSYNFALVDLSQDKIAHRLDAFYQGSWFGCWFALIQSKGDIVVFAITATISFVVFGGVRLGMTRERRRRGIARIGQAYRLREPLDLSKGQGRWITEYPVVVLIIVIEVGYATRSPYWTAGVWAVALLGVQPLYPSRDTGPWKWGVAGLATLSALSAGVLLSGQ